MYGGTKTEMERLLADATAISGVKYDINSLADVYTAIHVIQTELGITGTTALEASSTVSGSLQSMKASWGNLMISLGSGEGIDVALNNLMTSIGTFAQNILPVIGTVVMSIFTGLADGLEQNKEVVTTKFGELLVAILNALPDLSVALLKIVVILTEVLFNGLAELIGTLGIKMLELGYNLLKWIVDGINSGIAWIYAKVRSVGSGIVSSIRSALSGIYDVGANLIRGLWNGIASVTDWIISKVGGFGKRVLKKMKNIFKEKSPSKATYEMGYFLVKGLGNAIKDKGDIAVKEAERLAKDMLGVDFGMQDIDSIGRVQGVSSSLGGASTQQSFDNRSITQNFYTKQTSPYEAYKKVVKAYAN